MSTVTLPHGEIYYEEEGSGEPLLLVPGLGADLRIWQPVRSALARSFHLFMPDLPGCGRSAPCPDNITTADLAQCLADFLTARVAAPAHIIGQSYGGMLAQALALDHPEMLARVVLMSTAPAADARLQCIIRQWHDRAADADAARFHAEVLLWVATAAYYRNPRTYTAAMKYALAHPLRIRDFQSLAQAAQTFDRRADLHRWQHPALIIAGEEDMVFPPSVQREFAALIPSARLKFVPAAAHSLLLEGARAALPVLLDFLTAAD